MHTTNQVGERSCEEGVVDADLGCWVEGNRTGGRHDGRTSPEGAPACQLSSDYGGERLCEVIDVRVLDYHPLVPYTTYELLRITILKVLYRTVIL